MSEKKKKKIAGPVFLVSAAMIWGLSFVAQKNGMEYVDGFTFTTFRLFLAALALLPVVIYGKKHGINTLSPQEKAATDSISMDGGCSFMASISTPIWGSWAWRSTSPRCAASFTA